jgi:cytochrome c-type biogenesis protein CcmH/NrfF
MPRWRSSFLVLLVTAISLAQTSDLLDPNVRRVGEKLACLCGGCKNSVGSCPMLGCHYATPKREQIQKALAEGRNDQQIVDAAVKEQGLQALVTPPAEGFNILAWVMPFAMIGVGLLAIAFFIRHMNAKRVAADAPGLPNEALDRYHDQIEKETAKLE